MDEDGIVRRLRAAGCVFAEDEARLLVEAGADEPLIARRVAGEPLEHLLGWAEFAGLRIAVADGVFVPRRRTEFLARTAIALVRNAIARTDLARAEPASGKRGGAVRPVVLDLCCGAGAIAALIEHEYGDAVELHAAELDPAAVACARRTLPASVEVYEGDLFAALPAPLHGRVDVLVANVPYVPTDDIALMPPEARDHERRAALDGGPDGLDVARRVAAAARRWLAPGGVLLIETSGQQAPAAVQVLRSAGLAAQIRTSDRLLATVVLGFCDAGDDRHTRTGAVARKPAEGGRRPG